MDPGRLQRVLQWRHEALLRGCAPRRRAAVLRARRGARHWAAAAARDLRDSWAPELVADLGRRQGRRSGRPSGRKPPALVADGDGRELERRAGALQQVLVSLRGRLRRDTPGLAQADPGHDLPVARLRGPAKRRALHRSVPLTRSAATHDVMRAYGTTWIACLRHDVDRRTDRRE